MVNSTKNFIRITRDDSGEVAQFIVENFSVLYHYQGRRDLLGYNVLEEGCLYDCLIMRGDLLMKRDNLWTFQEGRFQATVIKRKEVIEHHSFFFGEPYEVPVEEDIKEEDLPIFVNEDDDAGLIELEYKEPEFTSLHDAILDVLSEGPLDRLGISTRIYQKYNKSINPDRIKGALSILIHSGEVLEKDNGTLNPLYINATTPFRSFHDVIKGMGVLSLKDKDTFNWTQKAACVYFGMKGRMPFTIETLKFHINGVYGLDLDIDTIKGMLEEMSEAGLIRKHFREEGVVAYSAID